MKLILTISALALLSSGAMASEQGCCRTETGTVTTDPSHPDAYLAVQNKIGNWTNSATTGLLLRGSGAGLRTRSFSREICDVKKS